MFDVVSRSPRETVVPRRVGPAHLRYGVISGALVEQFRRARDAQDAGETAEQFARDERVGRRRAPISLPSDAFTDEAYVDPALSFA